MSLGSVGLVESKVWKGTVTSLVKPGDIEHGQFRDGLSHGKNTSIICLFLPYFHQEADMWLNPHPLTVRELLKAVPDAIQYTFKDARDVRDAKDVTDEDREKERDRRHKLCNMNMNPSDDVLNYLFAHPEFIEPYYFAQNNNPRVVPYVLENHSNIVERYPDLIKKLFSTAFRVNEDIIHDDIIDKLWALRGKQVRGWSLVKLDNIVLNHPRAIELFIENFESFESLDSLDTLEYVILSSDERLVQIGLCQIETFEIAETITDAQRLRLNKFSTLKRQFLSRPVDMIVEWVMDQLSQNRERISYFIQANPHPRIVEWLLAHPQQIDSSYFVTNPHPDAVEWCKKWFSDNLNGPFYDRLVKAVKNPNVDLLLWVHSEYPDHFAEKLFLSAVALNDVDDKVIMKSN